MKKTRWIVVAIAIAIAIVFFAVAYVPQLLFELAFKAPNPVEFSKEAWDANPYNRPMVEDLLEKYDLTSMTKSEVIELLGEKNLTVGKNTLSYGTGGGYFRDEVLDIIFDENEKVISVGIAN